MSSVSDEDIAHLSDIRGHIRTLYRLSKPYLRKDGLFLDIGPQERDIRDYIGSLDVETLDINPASGCTFVGDITKHNEQIEDSRYDAVFCTEVLEHTAYPFDAVREMRRILKPGGTLFLSTPFNFRIHGPLPDYWRFTEHAIRLMLSDFSTVDIMTLETPGRPLMPIHYTSIAVK